MGELTGKLFSLVAVLVVVIFVIMNSLVPAVDTKSTQVEDAITTTTIGTTP